MIAALTALWLGALAAQEAAPGDPPGHTCWDTGNEEAARCYAAYAKWSARDADEALIVLLALLRRADRDGWFRRAEDRVGLALRAHAAAHADTEAFCAMQTASEPPERAGWTLDACRMEHRYDRAAQLQATAADLADETIVVPGTAWPEAGGGTACGTDDLASYADCQRANAAQAEAAVAALYALARAEAGAGAPDALAAWTAYAEAECALVRAMTRGASGAVASAASATCFRDAAESRLAQLR